MREGLLGSRRGCGGSRRSIASHEETNEGLCAWIGIERRSAVWSRRSLLRVEEGREHLLQDRLLVVIEEC